MKIRMLIVPVVLVALLTVVPIALVTQPLVTPIPSQPPQVDPARLEAHVKHL